MDSHPTTSITQSLAAKLGAGASAADIAAAVAGSWREIERSLSPVIGAGGVAALCKRAVHLAARDHPSLATHAGQVRNCDVDALQATLGAQTPDTAVAAGAAVLIQFNDLLAKLVGADLTERLLRSAWTFLSNGLPNQDAPS